MVQPNAGDLPRMRVSGMDRDSVQLHCQGVYEQTDFESSGRTVWRQTEYEDTTLPEAGDLSEPQACAYLYYEQMRWCISDLESLLDWQETGVPSSAFLYSNSTAQNPKRISETWREFDLSTGHWKVNKGIKLAGMPPRNERKATVVRGPTIIPVETEVQAVPDGTTGPVSPVGPSETRLLKKGSRAEQLKAATDVTPEGSPRAPGAAGRAL